MLVDALGIDGEVAENLLKAGGMTVELIVADARRLHRGECRRAAEEAEAILEQAREASGEARRAGAKPCRRRACRAASLPSRRSRRGSRLPAEEPAEPRRTGRRAGEEPAEEQTAEEPPAAADESSRRSAEPEDRRRLNRRPEPDAGRPEAQLMPESSDSDPKKRKVLDLIEDPTSSRPAASGSGRRREGADRSRTTKKEALNLFDEEDKNRGVRKTSQSGKALLPSISQAA